MNWFESLIKNFSRGEVLHFRCNVCGRSARAPQAKVTREQPTCRCGSTVRLRALVHVLSLEMFGTSRALPDFDRRPDIVGVDMSGANTYADGLARKFSCTNTFLHKSPHLDITDPDSTWLERCDFVISSDVFEHVAPPVSVAFDNTFRLLKPGGLFVFTVPYKKQGATVEHFPALHNYQVESQNGRRVLVNVTTGGQRQEFDNLVFHGGEGETLEMRVFSEAGVMDELQRAGFTDIKIHREPCLEHGIIWPQDWSLPISARRAGE